jgi:hypothetical protein
MQEDLYVPRISSDNEFIKAYEKQLQKDIPVAVKFVTKVRE